MYTLFLFCTISRAYTQLLPFVQPLSGTASSTTPASKQHSEAQSEQFANTIPSVGPPFAMTQWTPQTRETEQKCQAPYYYADTVINGFRASHWLSGSCVQDYGSFSIMPISGRLTNVLTNYGSAFRHTSEISSPAYYQVDLDRYNLRVEISGTCRSGLLKITALKTDSVYLLVRANSDESLGRLSLSESGDIEGKNPVHRIYEGSGKYAGFDTFCYLKTEQKASKSGAFKEGKLLSTSIIDGNQTSGIYLGFYLKKGETLKIKMGTSFSSLDGARHNLEQEIPDWDFERVKHELSRLWERNLAKVQITDADQEKKRVFYTAMYHALQHPRTFNDIDGTYPKFAGNHNLLKQEDANYYDDFSTWDIYRAQVPLLELIKPEIINDLIASLVQKGEQGGWLPIFPCWNSYTGAMIGDHVVSIISSAYLKGFRGYDADKAYALMRKNAFDMADSVDYKNGLGRRALQSYLRYGYIPLEDSVPDAFHQKEQVSRTLEYAYDDYALALMAKALGKEKDYNDLIRRAENYKHVFDPDVRMMRGRYADGKWYEPFQADKRQFYITEGTPRQYTFYVPQHIEGLIQLMGGKQVFEEALDSLFKGAYYWHGNEPGHQIPFLYNYTNAPSKTQRQVRRILSEEYASGPGGLSGNDDAGQLSAWYIFASLGFYPVNPVSGTYQLTTPNFQSFSLSLANGKKWTVSCDYSPNTHPFMKAVRWNGKRLTRSFFTYQELMQGGKIEIELSDKPQQTFGNNME